MSDAPAQVQKLEEELRAFSAFRRRHENELEQARQRIESLTASLKSLEEEHRRTLLERAGLESRLMGERREFEARSELTTQLETRLREQNDALVKLQVELLKTREAAADSAAALQRAEAEMKKGAEGRDRELSREVGQRAELETALKRSERRSELNARRVEDLQRELKELSEERLTLEAELRKAARQAESSGRRAEELEAELKRFFDKSAALDAELRIATERANTSETRAAELKGLARREAETSERLRAGLARLSEEKRRLETDLSRTKPAAPPPPRPAPPSEPSRPESSAQAAPAPMTGPTPPAPSAETEALKSDLERTRAELEALRARAENPPPRTEETAPPAVAGPESAEIAKALGALAPRLAQTGLQLQVLLRQRGQAPLANLMGVQEGLRTLSEYLAAPPPAAPQALAPLLESSLRPWEPALSRRGISLVRRFAKDAPACPVHPERLKLALHQLLLNAYEAMPRGGCVTVSLTAETDGVVLKLADTGPGFPPAVLKDPFGPHARANHLGLGLALVRRVFSGFGARVEAANEPGAAVLVRFPSIR